jgi:ATP-binding cassette subfamily C exporter for protease/lipase
MPAPPSPLKTAFLEQGTAWRQVWFFSFCIACLALAPSIYMLEVYDRVVNSRNALTLTMLTLLVLAIYAVLEILEWARAGVLFNVAQKAEQQLSARVFDASFVAMLRRLPGAGAQALSEAGLLGRSLPGLGGKLDNWPRRKPRKIPKNQATRRPPASLARKRKRL